MTLLLLVALAADPAMTLDAVRFGLVADGQTDDGPAIGRLLDELARRAGPATVVFPAGRVVRVLTARERYVFPLHQHADVTIDGRGCEFRLGPDVRFMRLTECRRVTVRDLTVDFDPLPFVDGTVTSVDAAAGALTIRLAPGRPAPLGGPTLRDGEQAFFAMLWHDGAYGLLSRHCWVDRMEAGPTPDSVVLRPAENFDGYAEVVPEHWRISLPVPGIAHRHGPGACFDLRDDDTLTFEDVELHAAPWFGFGITRCAGDVTFRRVHIRPKPGTGRLTSTWRDGFHVKGNSGTLLWDECIVEGTNDDAFNISTHTSRVRQVISPTRIEVLQAFPLGVMPWHVGAEVQAADVEARTLLGRATIAGIEGWRTDRRIGGQPAASPVILELDAPIAGLAEGAMIWEPAHANPRTTLRRCVIRSSCRLQSPVALESCDVTALLWFYAEGIEGPFPSGVTVRDCDLRRGRGNPRLAVAFAGRGPASEAPSAIRDVMLEGNRFWGDVALEGIDGLTLRHNQFLEPGAALRLDRSRDVVAVGNVGPEGVPAP